MRLPRFACPPLSRVQGRGEEGITRPIVPRRRASPNLRNRPELSAGSPRPAHPAFLLRPSAPDADLYSDPATELRGCHVRYLNSAAAGRGERLLRSAAGWWDVWERRGRHEREENLAEQSGRGSPRAGRRSRTGDGRAAPATGIGAAPGPLRPDRALRPSAVRPGGPARGRGAAAADSR